MDSKNWLLLFFVVGAIGFFGYHVIDSSSSEISQDIDLTPTPVSQVAGDGETEDWEKYAGKTIQFSYPPEWEPEERNPFGGTVIEDVELNIPKSTDNYLFYSASPYDSVKPEDITYEQSFEIKERDWIQWTREGEGYASYDFFTNDKVATGAGSFGIHVTLPEKNGDVEKKLRNLIQTIKFEDDILEEEASPSASITPTSTTSADLHE